MNEKRIRILLVDDHPVVLRGLTAMLTPESDLEVVGSASTGQQAITLYRELRPDVTIMDLSLTQEMTGTEATRAIRRDFPAARVIMLSTYKREQDIVGALRAGAITYLLKESLGDDLVTMIRQVHAGGRPIPADVAQKLTDHMFQSQLTAREVEVVEWIAKGLRNKEIADQLGISENTVQGHVKSILYKLKVNDRTGAVTAAIRRGILTITE